MKRHMRLCLACLLICCLLTATACAVFPDRDYFIGGETVTPERLAEISAQVFTQPDPTEPPTLPDIDPADLAYAGTVYWTPGGRVWHTDPSCYHIKNAETVSGTVQDAVAAHKYNVCTVCKKHAEQTD